MYNFKRTKFSVAVIIHFLLKEPTNQERRKSSRVNPAEQLIVGEKLENDKYQLKLQTNGNLVLLLNKTEVWSTNTTNATRLFMETGGNLGLLDKNNQILFQTFTKGEENYLMLEKDGKLLVKNKNGEILWNHLSQKSGKRIVGQSKSNSNYIFHFKSFIL